MPERPLVLFATPTVADKERKYGGPNAFYRPVYDRQLARISPKFAILQRALEQGNARITASANAIDPEYTLVFETVGDPDGFFTAVKNLKKSYPNVEWVMELSGICPNDDDFYSLNNRGVRDDSKQLSTKVFCVLTNQDALAQILSLWENYKRNGNFQFRTGLTGFKHLFETLKDVHQWGIKERIEDTGLLEDWNRELQYDENQSVRAQIELFFRGSETKRATAEQRTVDLITASGGGILSQSIIPEIHYHAILAEFPRAFAKRVLEKEEVSLVLADEIMFIKAAGQTAVVGLSEETEDAEELSLPERIISDPIIALLDGMPQENHPLLGNLIVLDDPDSFGSNYPVDDRVHCTSMASLVLRGQHMGSIKNEVRKIYVRPIMRSKRDLQGRVEEYIPNDFLLVDKIHECVRRLFEPVSGSVASSVRIINLSIGIAYREYYDMISPLARLLDWLSYKYRVLFIVSAGNHSDIIHLGMGFNDYATLDNSQKDSFVFSYLQNNSRNMRLLSPAESMNALTVGAVFSDDNDAAPTYNTAVLCSNGLPALYGSYGRGINGAVKPDILYPGGRCFIRNEISDPNAAKWVESCTRKPGIQSAYPNPTMAGMGAVSYTCGTSNSTALITNQASECFAVLNDVFIAETGETIPRDHTAVLIKAMLAHGATWSDLSSLCIASLSLSGRQTKSEIHRFLGYGVADVNRVKECTQNQITLIGYGDIIQDQAFEYAIPLPFNFHTQKIRRKLTVTLAYLSPARPSTNKYRENQVWFTINNGDNIAGSRSEYDHNAVQRGTLQHEIFETDSTAVWDEADSLTIKVNCRADAAKIDNQPIPYAIFATFEIAPEYEIDVYQTVVEKIHIRDAITPNID